jgi:hypothetical protein
MDSHGDSSREWLPDKEECRYSFVLLTQSRSNSASFLRQILGRTFSITLRCERRIERVIANVQDEFIRRQGREIRA